MPHYMLQSIATATMSSRREEGLLRRRQGHSLRYCSGLELQSTHAQHRVQLFTQLLRIRSAVSQEQESWRLWVRRGDE
jgi:hypothetical protein